MVVLSHMFPKAQSAHAATACERPTFHAIASMRRSRYECSVPKGLSCGRSSVVERQLPKLYVVGSIPIARSNNLRPCLGTLINEF